MTGFFRLFLKIDDRNEAIEKALIKLFPHLHDTLPSCRVKKIFCHDFLGMLHFSVFIRTDVLQCSFFLFFPFLGIGTLRQDKKLEHTKETVKQSRVVGLSVIEVVSKSKISFWRRVASYFGQWPKNCVYCVRKFLFILFVC